ncbi:MAG: Com family DNA-binding transcriptional regulator [Candidatus Margulisiibacteriota bacterium]
MVDFRCTQCNRLLAKIDGSAKIEIKCPRCKCMNLFTEEIYITIESREPSSAEAAEGKEEAAGERE